MKALMLATASIRQDHRGPVLEVMPQARTDAERKLLETLAPILPLHFRLPYTSVAALTEDGSRIVAEQVRALWKG